MYKLIFALLLLTGSILKAQSTGIIYGSVNDETGLGISTADVFIDGTIFSVFTNEDGTYEMEVDAGTYEVIITAIGYDEVVQTLTVQNGERVEFSAILSSSLETTTQLGEAVVVGEVNRESEVSLLNAQRRAVVMQESIGAQELQRKGVSDVAGAVTKVSGISKQEGSSVIYVRGLGDRYNSTTMNGLPIPSNDPEFKNIDLSIFSTDILTYVGIDKVYNGSFFGDFAGGNVNIISKKHTGKGFFSLGMTSRINSNAIKDKNFKLQSGINWFGFDKVKNPNTLSEFAFENSLNPKKSVALGSGFSFSAGERFNVSENSRFSFFLTGTHDNDYTSIEEGYLKSGVNAQGTVQGKDFETFNSYQYTTNSTGYLNLSYQINRKNNINFNSLFVNSTNQKLEEGEGYIRDNANEGGFQRRGTYVQNQLWVNQLLGEHKLSDRTELNWALGYNTIKSDMPDRFQNMIEWKSQLNHYVISNSSASLNHRYFQTLDEDEAVGRLSLDFKFANSDDFGYRGKLTLGYNGRFKNRDFEAMQYNMSPNQAFQYITFDNIDAFYNQNNYASGLFSLTTFSGNSIEPQFYTGEQFIHGGFANIEYRVSPKLIAVLGLRAEMVNQNVEWNTSLDPSGDENELEEFQFLPSLNLKYELNNRQNLRFAVSKTYTLPQFKERAKFIYEDWGDTTYGNPFVYSSTDYNADLKWEIFPGIGELISVTAFGKYIENPINKFTVSSSTNDLSFGNTGDWGYVFGGELEVRKSIYKSDSSNPVQFTVGANASYAHTNQELSGDKIFEDTNGFLNANFTDEEARFQGASDLLVNGDISFTKDWQRGGSLMMTLAYNYFSDRIYAIGTDNRGNIVEKGIGTLDFILRSKINENIGVNFNARNLLNPSFERIQENADQDISVQHYKRGINFSIGINYQF